MTQSNQLSPMPEPVRVTHNCGEVEVEARPHGLVALVLHLGPGLKETVMLTREAAYQLGDILQDVAVPHMRRHEPAELALSQPFEDDMRPRMQEKPSCPHGWYDLSACVECTGHRRPDVETEPPIEWHDFQVDENAHEGRCACGAHILDAETDGYVPTTTKWWFRGERRCPKRRDSDKASRGGPC